MDMAKTVIAMAEHGNNGNTHGYTISTTRHNDDNDDDGHYDDGHNDDGTTAARNDKRDRAILKVG